VEKITQWRASLFAPFIWDDEIGGACGTSEAVRNAYKVSVAQPHRKRQLGRPRHRWEINGSLKNRVRHVNWIQLAQDTVESPAFLEGDNEPSDSIKTGNSET
jgi:hypothetical protein